MRGTWETRELPVLVAVVKLLEQPDSSWPTVSQISDETGIDKADVDRALKIFNGGGTDLVTAGLRCGMPGA